MAYVRTPGGGSSGGTGATSPADVSNVVYARNHGVVPGTADTTTAMDATLAALGGNPGVVVLDSGTYTMQVRGLDTGQALVGRGDSTIIQLPAGKNGHVVTTKNFATLTGQDTVAAPSNFLISDLIIDGNKANQTAGAWHGLAVFGFGYTIRGVKIRNTRGVGLWSEFGKQSTSPGADSMESFVSDFKIHDCDGVVNATTQGPGTTSGSGVVHIGPHDTHFDNGIIFHTGTATGNGSSAFDIPVDNYANGTTIDNVHVWGAGGYDYGLRINGQGMSTGPRLQIEGATVAQLYVSAPNNRVYGKLFPGSTTIGATAKGLVLAASLYGVTGEVKVENCGGGAVDLGSPSGNGINLRVHALYSSVACPTPAVIGTPAPTSSIQLHVVNSFSQSSALTTDTGAFFPVPKAYSAGAWQTVDPVLQGSSFAAPLKSGMYYFTLPTNAVSTSATLGNNTVRVAQFDVPRAVTLVRIGSEITTVGDVGSKLRLGIYADDGFGYPGALVADCGTINGDSATVQELTISVPLTAGRYWVGGAVQNVTTTSPTVRTFGTALSPAVGFGTIPAANATAAAYTMPSITGALPATWTASIATGGNAPRVFVKIA